MGNPFVETSNVTATAEVIQSTNKALNVSQVVEGASESELLSSTKPETKKASCILDQNLETCVSDVQVSFKESPPEDFSSGLPQSAKLTTDEQRPVQVTQ